MTDPATGDRSVSSTVEVAVDPETAFSAFTEELDLWWVRGPINHHAAGRMRELRCEPGVGGRLLEIYTDDDALELARITAWEPGKRVAWTSSIDDVLTDVSFEPSEAGTVVTVLARIPAGGQDKGGTSWTRVVPKWFGPWVARRDRVPHQVRDIARLALTVSYAKPASAARWLAEVFGFASPDPLPEGPDPLPEGHYGHPWIEFRIGNGSLIIAKLEGDRPAHASVCEPWVYVDDVAAHYRHSTERGATIVRELASPWGLPFYVAEDLEGNRWTIAQARPTMS
ncbi:MAG TPA: hypothetical protein VJ914_05465 [Pseudonocardiaceae bacterium]|nr:hypothetical protein [Pseudonocardiaceae bacterium]